MRKSGKKTYVKVIRYSSTELRHGHLPLPSRSWMHWTNGV